MVKAKKTSKASKDFSSLDQTELSKELTAARKELFTLRMRHSLGELKQPLLVRVARRSIAQISTALHSSI